MSIIYYGDNHGRIDFDKIVQSAEARNQDTVIVQVGDLGTFFPSTRAIKRFKETGVIERWNTSKLDRWFQKRADRGWTVPIYTCGGNHDNWNVFYDLWNEQGRPDKVELYPNSGLYFIPRGTTIDIQGISHLFMGGAESTDQHRRTPNTTWWDREEGTQEEFLKFFDSLEGDKPDTVVSHDAPLRIKLDRLRRNSSRTPRNFETALKLSSHQPKRWYFGHHHKLKKWSIKPTKFYCCGLHGQYWERS